MPGAYQKIPLINALSPATGFGLPFIGNEKLNQRGLHLLRIELSDRALSARKKFFNDIPVIAKEVQDNGVAVVDNFMNAAVFPALQQEIRDVIGACEKNNPIQNDSDERFGSKRHFDGGFDRYDGDTLNRFIDIDRQAMTQCASFLDSEALQNSCEQATGTRFNTEKFQIYLTQQQGDQNKIADPQLSLHRDTFFSCLKLWYFTEDVALEDGPFLYSPGSHLMTPKRRQWEKEKSIHAARTNSGGSFRIDENELAELDYAPVKAYPVKANTLVMADVRGFHARGAATVPGARRVSIYGNIRPWPFAPLRYRC